MDGFAGLSCLISSKVFVLFVSFVVKRFCQRTFCELLKLFLQRFVTKARQLTGIFSFDSEERRFGSGKWFGIVRSLIRDASFYLRLSGHLTIFSARTIASFSINQMNRLEHVELQPGQESVWDYPRPPRLETTSRRVRVIFNQVVIADSTRVWRLLETSHPPTYYIPAADIRLELLCETAQQTYCEWKGAASYFDLRVGDRAAAGVAWCYHQPNQRYAELKDHLAFYASRVDECYVDDARVSAQPGDFYGGWITSDIVGPFKGSAGTWGW